jgi:hypothetical protein
MISILSPHFLIGFRRLIGVDAIKHESGNEMGWIISLKNKAVLMFAVDL